MSVKGSLLDLLLAVRASGDAAVLPRPVVRSVISTSLEATETLTGPGAIAAPAALADEEEDAAVADGPGPCGSSGASAAGQRASGGRRGPLLLALGLASTSASACCRRPLQAAMETPQ
mmetsp:Transcript_67696/g.201315  ORF Transcript_67696/g.201315 Transcript_67696/m.201315 type:complete len:118 (+) Transcript_67696:621-974(+)